MSGVGFYLPAVLLLAAAVLTVAAERSRTAILGLLGFWLATALLFLATGAYLLGVAEAVLPLLAAGSLLGLGKRARYDELLRAGVRLQTRWPVYVAVSAAIFAVLAIAAWMETSHVPASTLSAHLITVLHYRYLPSLILAGLAVLTALYLLVIIGRHSEDERNYDSAAERRRERDEKLRQRQRDREAARSQRRAGV